MATRNHPLYETWRSMIRRCLDKKHKDFTYYGARGVLLDHRWKNFETFVYEVGEKPSPKHSLDRIDNNNGYFPWNVHWATKREQALNRRVTHECYKGHLWTDENTIWTHNGRTRSRRCRLCYENRIKEKRRVK